MTTTAPAGPWAALLASCPWDVDTAAAIMWRESRDQPGAYNPTPVWSGGRWLHAQGLFQVLGGPYDPAANVALACSMWRTSGWAPWRL